MSRASNGAPAPHIAILGSRGIPARFGGFETFAEQLAVRLVRRGWRVTVFCEGDSAGAPAVYEGVRLRYVRTPNIVGLRSIWADLVAILACLCGYDRVYMLGYHAAFAFVLPRLFGVDFWVNMDGLEWRRAKWSRTAQTYLRLSEGLAAHLAHHLIADASAIGAHLARHYPSCANKVCVIPYGVEVPPLAPTRLLHRWGLAPGGYVLVVCRLEPENHVLEIIRGWRAAQTACPLVIVGDHRSRTGYVQALLHAAGDGVRFIGAVYEPEPLIALRQGCRVYLHGHSVGGTNPSLLEAMACGNRIIAHDNPFNREVLGDLGRYFSDADDVVAQLRELAQDAAGETIAAGMIARARARFDWERITERYIAVFSGDRTRA